jgi:hypothetical protein
MARIGASLTLLSLANAVFFEKPKLKRDKLNLKKNGTKNANEWCMEGHLVPSVFQIGFQKAGSSSLWDQLVNKVGLKRGCGEVGKPCKVWGKEEPLYMKKELHFFDQDERFEKGMAFYAAHFPKCSEVAKDDQAMDGTPNYITDGKKVALRIKDAYGEKAKDLHFVLIVRSPAKRMEAGYWHFMKDVDGGFENYIDKTYNKAKLWIKNTSMPEPSHPNPYHGSLYGKWLAEYLEVFDGSQFTVVTLEQYTKTPQKVASFISNRIKFRQQTVIEAPEHKHEREHPKMMSTTTSKLLGLFDDDQALWDKLVKKHCMAMDCGTGLSFM